MLHQDHAANESLPPGTVVLLQHQTASDSDEIVFSPQPSDDPNEPLNWSARRKWLNMTLIFAMTYAAFTVLMIQTVFWQQMIVELGFSISQLNNGKSAQLAGLAIGCLVFIPLTVKFGRRSTYILSTAALAASCWWSAKMNTFAELILTNVLAGLAGAINETAVQMTIADLFFVHQRGTANGFYFVAVNFGCFLSPIAAGNQAAAQGWRWSYYTLAICLTVLCIAFLFAYEGTKYVPLLVAQSQTTAADTGFTEDTPKDRDKDPRSNISAVTTPRLNIYRQRMRLSTTTNESLWKLFLLPLEVVTLPHVLFTSLQFACGIMWLVFLSAMTSVIFSMPPYSFSPAGIGYMALGPFVGNILGNFYGGPFSDWLVVRLAKRNNHVFEPEMRLMPLFFPAFCISGGLIMFGVTADRGMHWIWPSIGGAIFSFGLGSIAEISFTLLVDSYKELTAEAFVGVAFFRNAISIGVTFAMVPWWTAVGLSNMFITIGCVAFTVAAIYVPVLFWGKHIRTALAPRYYRLIGKKQQL